MYPLAVILAVGWWRKNKEIHVYALPLSIVGWLVAVYHNLLYYHLIGQQTFACTLGASCSERYIHWLGFITIPLLSLTAFTIINGCLLFSIYFKRLHK
jgi:disulfide bond formation protein DsbB